MTSRVDFTSQEFFRDPSAGVAKLRALGPVVEVQFPIIGKVWTTTTEELASRVLKDSATFTLRKDNGDVAGLRWWMPGVIKTVADNMLSKDEPDHTRLRQMVDEAFRRRAILGMEPRIFAAAEARRTNCLPTAAPPIWSIAMPGGCRFLSSASCLGCRKRTARSSWPGRGTLRA
jgi:cytochrome P450